MRTVNAAQTMQDQPDKDASMKTVVVATHNANKVTEIQSILHTTGWSFISLDALSISDEPIEDADSFIGNARIKAQAAHESTGLAALADDSGLVVDALDGNPGVYSSRYAGDEASDAQNNQKLLRELEGVPKERRTARFACAVVFIDADGKEYVASGTCEGMIAEEPAGSNGFGYDPLFLPADYDGTRSMAELLPAEKNAISHRARALESLRQQLADDHVSVDIQNLAVFDFDGTILEGHSPVLLVYKLYNMGIIPFAPAMRILWWGIRYKLRFSMEQAIVRQRIFRTLVHFPAKEANKLMTDLYHEQLISRLRPKALERIRDHQARGDKVILVSASFEPILEKLMHDVQADDMISTRMEVIDGFYTGNVAGTPPEGEEKLIQLRALADQRYGKDGWQLDWAYGDHFSDRFLIAAAKHPVAVNPGARLQRLATREGWQIEDWSL
ncbi:MAG: RdgB/HAM1 family non-canonical purine NTP pyrophosphatase [Coriobacteriaceae bacterium]|nr:RdgB/HAM1 family non-canonical purine NTP pyrophosphatase [Coriobacteriaceae bacterium]